MSQPPATQCHVSLFTAYMACQHLNGLNPRDQKIRGNLMSLMCDRASRMGCERLLSLAETGMKDAVVPFQRPDLDVLYAGALGRGISAFSLRGLGLEVPTGYFQVTRQSVDYVDTVRREVRMVEEVLNPGRLQDWLSMTSKWHEAPTVVADDFEQGQLLTVRQPFAGPEASTADLEWGHVHVYQVRDRGRTVKEVCRGKVHFERLRFADEVHWRVFAPPAEVLMEMHAAVLAMNEEENSGTSATSATSVPSVPSLWVQVRIGDWTSTGTTFVAPLPDLMRFGAETQGWWAPMLMSKGVAPPDVDTLQVTLNEAVYLMRQFSWAWIPDPMDWVRCAWAAMAAMNASGDEESKK